MAIRRLPLFLLSFFVAFAARSQSLTTSNAFVSASVQSSTGWIGISASGQALSFANHSYLSLIIDGKYYTSNNSGPSKATQTIGGTATVQYPDVSLIGGTSTKRGDTIITVWNEGTFDIQQRVYPVVFRASGQIVLSVRIVNRNTVPLTVNGLQWLNDVHIGSNKVPHILERNYYDDQFTRVPPNDGTDPTPPSFYAAFENDIRSTSVGLIGAGFTNDSFPPSALGLTPPKEFAAVDWSIVSEYTFGAPASIQQWTPAQDMACFLLWTPKNVPAAKLGDSVTVEEFRTSYGTQEFCMCIGSNALAINVYPTHITTAKRLSPIELVSMVFNISQAVMPSVKEMQDATGPLRIVSGDTAPARIGRNLMKDFRWFDSAAIGAAGFYAVNFHITTSDTSEFWTCQQNSGACGILYDGAVALSGNPIATLLSRTGSYDGSACNARQTSIRIYDTGSRRSSISATPEVAINMRVSIPATKQPTDTLVYQVDVIDSMLDGTAVVAIRDTLGSTIRDTVHYCTIPDAHAPAYTVTDISKFAKEIALTDTLPWDRGLVKNLSLSGSNAFVLAPDPTCPIPSCCSTYKFRVTLSDTTMIGTWKVSVNVFDCGNKTLTIPLTFENSGASVDRPTASIGIYPNPITNELFIELASDSPQLAIIQDMLGRTVAEFTITRSTQFDASQLPEGTYIVRVGGAVQRIVKTR